MESYSVTYFSHPKQDFVMSAINSFNFPESKPISEKTPLRYGISNPLRQQCITQEVG